MRDLLYTRNFPWITGENRVEVYLSDEQPPVEECTAAYALAFKDGTLLQTDLKEGERPVRQLDIPGGHIEPGETPQQSVVRETFEETGVRIQVVRQVAYFKITILSEKPAGFNYPYPVSYMLFYLGVVLEETDFQGNDEAYGRVWLSPDKFDTSEWCMENRELLDAVLKML